jgi:hypothetical protein
MIPSRPCTGEDWPHRLPVYAEAGVFSGLYYLCGLRREAGKGGGGTICQSVNPALPHCSCYQPFFPLLRKHGKQLNPRQLLHHCYFTSSREKASTLSGEILSW